MQAETQRDALPMDWDEWRTLWTTFERKNLQRRKGTNPFPAKNFLADEILGVYTIAGEPVELSEVTMPDFGARDARGHLTHDRVRYVGITYWRNGRCEAGDLVSTLADLKQELGL